MAKQFVFQKLAACDRTNKAIKSIFDQIKSLSSIIN